MKRYLNIFLLFFIPFFVVTCKKNNPVEFELEGKGVLFIGNSLTSANDLPGMLSRMMKQANIVFEGIEAITVGGYGLEDHYWLGGKGVNVREQITKGNWQIVVLQQGPSATEGRPSLLEYSQKFNEDAKKIGARTAL